MLTQQAITYSVSYEALQKVYQNNANAQAMGRKAAEGLYIKKANREITLLTDSPEQRYLNLLRQQPKLIKHIPLKYPASYLGISPETLSRIRSRIS